METAFTICISAFVAILATILAILKRSRTAKKHLPPSPWSLPIIGHMHHLADGLPTHQSLRKLSQKYGDLIYLKLGEIPTVLVSSPRAAKEILGTQDLVFASKPSILLGKALFYNSSDVSFSPYGDHWRQMRKICTMELLTVKRVESFGKIRQEKATHLVASVAAMVGSGEPVNLSLTLSQYNSSMVMEATLGNVAREDQAAFIPLISKASLLGTCVEISDIFPSLKVLHPFLSNEREMMRIHRDLDQILERMIDGRRSEHVNGEDFLGVLLSLQESNSNPQMVITRNTIKGILLDMIFGGTETPTTIVEWAMAEMMKHPDVMAKAQSEVREGLGKNKTTIEETEIHELKYLKLVVKETFRLHPPTPFLFPRESRQETQIDGYNIPAKTRILVNVWAISRDPKYWDDPESFKPERFENSSIEFSGSHYEYIPFGSGRRMCPGMNFGLANVYLTLALLLYHFDWELPNGLKPSELDMTEGVGVAVAPATNLLLLPKLSANIPLA